MATKIEKVDEDDKLGPEGLALVAFLVAQRGGSKATSVVVQINHGNDKMSVEDVADKDGKSVLR